MIGRILAPNVALIGFMASGKTTVGEVLAARWGLPFHDVDLLVELAEGMSVAEIFAHRGEAHFREVEGMIFRGLCEQQGIVIGCGGGTLIDPLNRASLATRCFAVWLRASAGEILRRIEQGGPARPLLHGADPAIVVPQLLQAREGLYAGSDLVVETDGRSVEQIVAEICAHAGFPVGPPP